MISDSRIDTLAQRSQSRALEAEAEHLSAPQRAARVGPRTAYLRGLLVVAVLYVGLYGWLLVSTNGFPYVMDANESFSSLVHASNIFRFGLSQSFGLTDEAYGP